MLTERQSQISTLVRENTARSVREDFLPRLSRILDRSIDADSLISVEASDAIRNAFRDGYRRAVAKGEGTFRALWPQKEKSSAFAEVNRFRIHFRDSPMFLLSTEFEPCVKVTAKEVLERAEAVLVFDGDTLALASVDGVSGFMLDWNPEDPEETYELAIWDDQPLGARA